MGRNLVLLGRLCIFPLPPWGYLIWGAIVLHFQQDNYRFKFCNPNGSASSLGRANPPSGLDSPVRIMVLLK